VDAASGQAWVGFTSNETATPGVFANAVGPGGPAGARRLAPGSTKGKSFAQAIGRTPISERIGAAGVFLAYGQGYPTFETVAVWRVDSAKPQLVVKASDAKHVTLAAAPEGRLWLVWDRGGAIYATRTNHAATKAEPLSTLKPPGSRSVYELEGDGSAGPLELFANDGKGLWHQQVRPRLQLSASSKSAGAGRTITFRVLDAGDQVAGATVKAGGKSLRTAANGTAVLKQAARAAVQATATKPGYVSASASVR
jgi:hypothetical protein